MKKSFWGYKPQEVDENIEFMEAQNLRLERQVKQLTAELDKTKKELEEANAAQIGAVDFDASAADPAVVDELQHKLAEAELEKLELSAKITSLDKKISEMTDAAETAKDGKDFDDVGNICRLAYEDMHTTKQKTKDYLTDFLDQFWQKWSNYENLFSELMEQVLERQKESKEKFISYADYVLQSYDDMEGSNRELDSYIAEIVERKNNIADDLNSIIAELDKSFENEDPQEPEIDSAQAESDVSDEEEAKHSILATVRKMRDAKVAAKKKQEEAKAEKAEAAPVEKAEKPKRSENKEEPTSISPIVNIRNII